MWMFAPRRRKRWRRQRDCRRAGIGGCWSGAKIGRAPVEWKARHEIGPARGAGDAEKNWHEPRRGCAAEVNAACAIGGVKAPESRAVSLNHEGTPMYTNPT